MRKQAAIAIALAVFGAGPSALAEAGAAGDGFEPLVADAMSSYQAREYERAVELFEQAYEIRPEPDLVYNIARSQERLAHREEAIEAYERFLSLPGTTGELRARALANVRSLREEIAALDAAAGPRTDGGVGGTGPAAPPVEPPPRSAAPAADRGSSSMGTAGYALLGIGAAAMIGGAIFGGMALSANSRYEEAGFSQDRLDLRADVESRALAADILLFGGAGIAAVGIVLAAVAAVRARAAAGPEAQRGPSVFPTLAFGGGAELGLACRW
jgi:tetratricopeptide (TPR) repeat protein